MTNKAISKITYYSKKLLILVVSVFVLSVLVFCMSRLAPGDPLVSYYGDRTEKMSQEEREQTMERLGLNDSLYVQYERWIQNALKGDFGISYKYKQDVTEVIGSRIANTVILGGIGFVLSFGLALLLGLLCAWHEERLIDRVICKVGTITSCIPEFWASLILILLFSVTWKLLPSSGAYCVGQAGDVSDRLQHLILPLSVIVLSHLWYYAYMIRNKILEETRADYVLLGKSKGQSKAKIMLCHCLRNIMPSYISLMAISVPHILGGTYIVETVFSYPGIGTLTFESAKYHDYNMLMLLCLITGFVVILFNILGQVLSEKIDPRMAIAGEGIADARKEAHSYE